MEWSSTILGGDSLSRSATSSRSGPSYTTGIRCSRPGSAIGGRLAASRLMAAPRTSGVVWSGSKCTVTPVYPATAWRTSRRFFKAVASAIARVFSAVSSRVPSSASSAVSPSGWILTRGAGRVEGGGGICAHKDGVEDAREEADAEQPYARDSDDPCGHDRGRDQVPDRKIALDVAERGPKVEQIPRPPRRGETARPMRHQDQQQQAPREREQQSRFNVRKYLGLRVAHWPRMGAADRIGQRIQRHDERR